MFYEYAITPEVFDPAHLAGNGARGVILTQLLRGLCENGMIADLHKGAWRRDVSARVGHVTAQKLKDQLIALLETLDNRKRLVRHPKAACAPSTDFDWLNLALEAHGRAALNAIILSSELHATSGCSENVLSPFDSLLDAQHWQGRQTSITIKQCEAGYRALLPPILRHAKRLYLIDPYLRPDLQRSTDTIMLCGQLLGDRGGDALQGIIEVHTSDACERRATPRTVPDEKARWQQWIAKQFKSVCPRHTVTVSLWAEETGGERFHDRFLITDQVGFSVAGGLDCVKASLGTPSDTVWTLLEEQDRQKWLKKFQSGTSPFIKR